jgi:hypothetical protein
MSYDKHYQLTHLTKDYDQQHNYNTKNYYIYIPRPYPYYTGNLLKKATFALNYNIKKNYELKNNIKEIYYNVMKELKQKYKNYEPGIENKIKNLKPEELEPSSDLDNNRIKMLSLLNKEIIQVKTYKFWVILTNVSKNSHFISKNSLINRHSLTGKMICYTFLHDKSKLNFIDRIAYLNNAYNIIILFVPKKAKYLDNSASQIIEDILNDDKSFQKIKNDISPFKIVLNH